jgi:hypothetical protein
VAPQYLELGKQILMGGVLHEPETLLPGKQTLVRITLNIGIDPTREVKVKKSLYGPGQALIAQKGYGFHNISTIDI